MVKTPDGEQAIETLRVGQRVTTGSGDDRDADIPDIQPEVADTPIDPDTWRVVQLSLKTEEGEHLTVELLRPLDWLAEHGAEPGAVIQLDLPELGASGPAKVVAILSCPEIESGPGRVVTATFHHASGDIYDLRITGQFDPIGVTANHPFWSEDRQAWLPATRFRPGETLRAFDGPAQVVSIDQTEEHKPVYNIEVDVDHVYRIGESGVLVHNQLVQKRNELGQFSLLKPGQVNVGRPNEERLQMALKRIFGEGNVRGEIQIHLDTTEYTTGRAKYAGVQHPTNWVKPDVQVRLPDHIRAEVLEFARANPDLLPLAGTSPRDILLFKSKPQSGKFQRGQKRGFEQISERGGKVRSEGAFIDRGERIAPTKVHCITPEQLNRLE